LKTKTIQILINYQKQTRISFDLHSFIARLLELKSVTGGVFEFTFVDNTTIRKLNHLYFKKKGTTDIISFNLGTETEILGDIYIAVDVAKQNAKRFGNTFDNEIKLLLAHGILHLLGYRDYSDEERHEMEWEQNRLLEELIL